ncbi:MAG TPA: hypothetical protein V6D02_04735 [Candidatus Obscuribacterales bacterium]
MAGDSPPPDGIAIALSRRSPDLLGLGRADSPVSPGLTPSFSPLGLKVQTIPSPP